MPIVKTDKKPGTLEMVAIVIATHLFVSLHYFTYVFICVVCVYVCVYSYVCVFIYVYMFKQGIRVVTVITI